MDPPFGVGMIEHLVEIVARHLLLWNFRLFSSSSSRSHIAGENVLLYFFMSVSVRDTVAVIVFVRPGHTDRYGHAKRKRCL